MVNSLGQIVRSAASRLPSALVRPFGRPVALFFHGVESRIIDSRVQTNHHDANAFIEIARFLRNNFDVLPLSALDGVLKRPRRDRRIVFLMSDDGYANNLAVAADILDQFALPWTLFVSTHHIGTARLNPMFLARLFFLFAPPGAYDIPHLASRIELSSLGERESTARHWLDRLKALDAVRANEAVAAMEVALEPTDLPALLERFRSDRFLNWDEVRTLKKRGVEIGAHAHLHWPMHGAQTRDYLIEQALLPRERIEAEIGPCRYFAYPFGNTPDICREAWQAVRDAGYEYGFTTLSGSLDASENRWLMPRYGLELREPRLPSVIPFLRAGNARLTAWQRQMAD
jgi:peptidoglycan/xylan/chitin deacetylase (PgdA/CDA1 family)